MDTQLLPVTGNDLPEGVRFFFTGRGGGVSGGSYGSLNLGLHVGDRPEDVRENRRRVMAALGVDPGALCLVNQVHGRRTWRVDSPFSDGPPDGDAMVTSRPGLVLGIMTADCVPVLLADAGARVVGAAHAGWRGALAGILDSCLAEMAGLGARSERVFALIGPCVRAPEYEVDDGLRRRFLEAPEGPDPAFVGELFTPGERAGFFMFDLAGYVQMRLIHNGVDAGRIRDIGHCTSAMENTYFSHRRATRQGADPCGRQMGGVFLLPG
ncbi:MAG: peptidoglycan editing factor PgeF [Magnetococcales bacterium]|nr:peptidoglycan editing factor PgeF [Magnetococcales bacterium]MBF0156642.1 peptidoglycan editing factor PgeF [Magnetococcales bacterium]